MHIPVDSVLSRQVTQVVYRYLNGPVPFGFTIAFFGFVALIWTAPTLFVDYFVVAAAVRRDDALGFPKAKGRITASEVESTPGEKETIYQPKIVYQYRVHDQDYEGSHVRFDEVSSDRPSEARKAVDAYPVGRTVDVFYDASDPSRSALEVGLNGSDPLWGMLLLPFNVFAAWLWTIVGRTAYRRIVKPPAGGASISSDGLRRAFGCPGPRPLPLGRCTPPA